ncbi:MAG TPA: GNAT family N-acetyltransferase [Acidimicrobiales bacterium]|nr:GNAT family N-acetyltransferase [Acidimicrobiales bacterium]
MLSVWLSDDPGEVLARAGDGLRRDPVRHNVLLTLLHARVRSPQPGRYWTIWSGSTFLGLVFQSPLDFEATITPMGGEAVDAAVDAVVGAGVLLPGVNGEAATAARFAGAWTERTGGGARPYMGQRLYEVDTVVPARPTPGSCRPATEGDAALLTAWGAAFQQETGDTGGNPAETVQRRIGAGELFVWDDDGPTSMAGVSAPVAGTARVGPVFTPVEARGRGRASALVAAVSVSVRGGGDRCILYTDLGNPTSNGIYRALGYRVGMEALKYRFEYG